MAIDGSTPKDPRGKVISKFQVFWNDLSPKQVLILQFPNRNRTQPYNRLNNLQPTRIRLKPNTGVVEVDVPLDSQARGHFNKDKSLKFGTDLSKNKTVKAGGSFGIAGGFGAGSVNNRRAFVADLPPEDITKDPDTQYAEAEERNQVLKTLTLSGKIQQAKAGDPMYAMATFKGDEMHLTPVSAICSLSPHYTHLDAAADNEKASRMREADSGPAETEARAINVSVRSSDLENASPDDIGKTLRALQEENWAELEWEDEEADQAYLAFQNNLFYRETEGGSKLVSLMSSMVYLDAISAPKVDDKVVGEKITQRHRANVADDWDESTDSDTTDVEIMQEEGQRRENAIN